MNFEDKKQPKRIRRETTEHKGSEKRASSITADTPLEFSPYEKPNPIGRKNIPSWIRDAAGIMGFIAAVLLGAWLINRFLFQSFNVVGPSMEPTLEGEHGTHDRLIVNRLPVTIARIQGQYYSPVRGEIIVFKNPLHDKSTVGSDEYIVKRVIATAGERVTVDNCKLTVYNSAHPNGYDPYPTFTNLGEHDNTINDCVSGSGTDVTVPKDHVFVVGDHRAGNYSMDSRDGEGRSSLGTIHTKDVVGPAVARIWPLNKFTTF